jgi:Flp pilus assembly protein TadD
LLADAVRTATSDRVGEWIQQILEALALAHAGGVIHRHLHEDLVVVDSTERAVVGGFGLSLTRKVEQPALPAELLRGAGASEPTDQFLAAAMIGRIAAVIRPPRALNAVLDRAMAEDPADRYADILDFADALRAVWGAGEPAATVGPRPAVADPDSVRDRMMVATENSEAMATESLDEAQRQTAGRSLFVVVSAAAAIVVSLLAWWVLDSRPPAIDPAGVESVLPRSVSTSPMGDAADAIAAGDTMTAMDILADLADDPESPYRVVALDTMGTIHLQEGRSSEAVAVFARALKLKAGEDLYFKMVLAQAASGDDTAARRTLGEALNLYPDSRRLDEARRHLGGV